MAGSGLELLGDLVDGESAEFGVVDAVDAPEGFLACQASRTSPWGRLRRAGPAVSLAGAADALMAGDEQFARPIQRVVLWPRWPRVWFWTLRRTSSSALLASFTTWNGSATCFA